jgi:hypothetical protein
MTFSTSPSPGVTLQGGGSSGGGGGGTPGGSSGQVQYNNGGAFGGMAGTSWDNTTRALTITGYSLTGSASASFMDLAGTWNTSGTPTAIKLNITDTASNAASLLMDLQVGGSTVLRVGKDGSLTNPTYAGTLSWRNGDMQINSSLNFIWSSGGFIAGSGGVIAFKDQASIGGSTDVRLTRRGAANLRLGAADAAAPVAQTLSVQSVVAGTTNTAGTNLTITGSQGTGASAGGSLIFQVAPAGSSGTAQNALVAALTIASTRTITHSLNTTDYTSHVPAGQISGYLNALGRGTAIIFDDGSGNGTGAAFWLGANGVVKWQSVNRTDSGSTDLILARDAANTLALRNGTAAQEFRVYGTTDGTNSEFLAVRATTGGAFEIGPRRTGTGAAQNGVLNATAGSGSSTIACLSWGSFGNGFLQTSVGFSSAAADTYDLGSTSGGIGGAFRRLFLAQFIETKEMTAPAAPAANGVRIYAEDNGSGKTRLMAIFATGAAQQIAIEP